jgi:hypothetical protein
MKNQRDDRVVILAGCNDRMDNAGRRATSRLTGNRHAKPINL